MEIPRSNGIAGLGVLNGLLSYWKLESGNPTLDVYGINGLGSTAVGTFEAAKIGSGFRVPAAASITENTLNALFNTAEFTVSFWLKINAAATINPYNVIAKMGNDGGGNDGWRIQINTLSNVALTLFKNGVSFGPAQVGPLTLATWYFIVLRYRASDTKGIINLYNEASLLSQNEATSSNYEAAPTTKIVIGDGTSTGLNFTIDELTPWNRALSDAEVNFMWNSGAGRSYPL